MTSDASPAVVNLAWSLRGPSAQAWVQKADLRNVLAQLAEARAELDRLWHFVDTNDQLHDVITGAPDHYIVNGDHSGCNCGTDWTPPALRVEWSAETDSVRLPVLPEASARQWAERPGYRLVRRLVGPWRDVDPPSATDATATHGQQTTRQTEGDDDA